MKVDSASGQRLVEGVKQQKEGSSIIIEDLQEEINQEANDEDDKDNGV